jgi:DNA-binding NtrC family response regulator
MKKKERGVRTRILFIGENPDIPLFTALQSQGYKAMACDSPQRACALVYSFRPHLIVVHLRHPSRNDITTLQECRLVAKGIPIVVTTSNSGHETVMRALEEGATSFLSLPVEGAKIKKVVDDLLGSHESTLTKNDIPE